MSIVSGIATASGVSSLLNAPGNSKTESSRIVRGEAASGSTDVLRVDETLMRIVERVSGPADGSNRQSPQGFQPGLTPGDARYSRFVDAVQALRLDEAAAAELTPDRVAELKAAAAEVFNMHSGIPREQRPVELLDEQREAQAEREAAAQEARAQAIQQIQDQERAGNAAKPSGQPEQGAGVDPQTPDSPAMDTGLPEIAVAQPTPELPDVAVPESGEKVPAPSGTTPPAIDVAAPQAERVSEPTPSTPQPA